MGKKSLSLFETAQAQLDLDEVANILHLEPSIHAILRGSMRELYVSTPLRMDDGWKALR